MWRRTDTFGSSAIVLLSWRWCFSESCAWRRVRRLSGEWPSGRLGPGLPDDWGLEILKEVSAGVEVERGYARWLKPKICLKQISAMPCLMQRDAISLWSHAKLTSESLDYTFFYVAQFVYSPSPIESAWSVHPIKYFFIQPFVRLFSHRL